MKTVPNNAFMKSISLIILFFLCLPYQAQTLQHVEPSNWWVGMEHHRVQVLLHGQEIAKYKVEVSGLAILEEVRTENPNYIFLDLVIDATAKPGKFNFPFLKRKGSLNKISAYFMVA